MKTWLKGGILVFPVLIIITLIIGIIILILTGGSCRVIRCTSEAIGSCPKALPLSSCFSLPFYMILSLPTSSVFWIAKEIGYAVSFPPSGLKHILSIWFIFDVIIWFVIGALIGWFYKVIRFTTKK